MDILKAMWAKRLTQAEICRATGIKSEARLSRIINFVTEPNEVEIDSLCKLLGLKKLLKLEELENVNQIRFQ